jgi:hypothetical protein
MKAAKLTRDEREALHLALDEATVAAAALQVALDADARDDRAIARARQATLWQLGFLDDVERIRAARASTPARVAATTGGERDA